MIRKSVQRFSEKIMLKQKNKAGCRFEETSSRFSLARWPSGNDARLKEAQALRASASKRPPNKMG